MVSYSSLSNILLASAAGYVYYLPRDACSFDFSLHEAFPLFHLLSAYSRYCTCPSGIFEQLPALQHEVFIPPYIRLGRLTSANIWLGTRGTVTALHIDREDNFLMQVGGFKYIRLYNKQQTPNLYPCAHPRSTSDSEDHTLR